MKKSVIDAWDLGTRHPDGQSAVDFRELGVHGLHEGVGVIKSDRIPAPVVPEDRVEQLPQSGGVSGLGLEQGPHSPVA
jgi:hypothetical protein